MNIQFLKKICFVLLAALFLSSTGKVMAQVEDNHFIYIQAENRKPFYVILDEKLYSSSSIGYLIIPKLKSGTYNLTLGFPQNAAPEQRFVTVVRNNDIGYSLKAAGNNTFTLTDLQTQEVLTANGKAPASPPRNTEPVVARAEPEVTEAPVVRETPPVVEEVAPPVQEEKVVVAEEPRKNRTFGDLMSSVSNDPDLAKSETAPATPKTPARDPFEDRLVRTTDKPVETPVARETTSVQEPVTAPVQTQVVTTTTTVASSPALADTYGVVRTSDQDANGGRSMSFVLLSTTSTDSVSIFVPYDEEQTGTGNGNTSAQNTERKRSIAYFDYDDLAQTPPPSNATTNRRRNRNDEKFLNNNSNTEPKNNQSGQVNNPFYSATPVESEESKQRSEETVSTAPVVSTRATSSSGCSGGSISDRDFSKMRNKMIGRDNDDDMISTAMDMLGNKCITTANVKTLGGLFITDNGRLKFFAAVKKNISDVENFSTLEDQIYDRGKKEQFRSLL